MTALPSSSVRSRILERARLDRERRARPSNPGSTERRVGEPVVRIEGLSKEYPVRRSWIEIARRPRGGRTATALEDVGFQVYKGEFFGLLGPNGAGKTTLFKILSTLVEPDSGEARVAGYDLRSEPDRVRSVVSPVIADERSLSWRLSAVENLRFYASLYDLSGETRERRVDELLHLVGLEEAGRKIVGAFSSGMKQRLLIARALLANPRVLLLDEPTRSLDPVAARRFRRFLRDELVGRRECTVLLATHNSDEAFDLCDRVGVLDRGRLVAVGKPDELSLRLAGSRYRIWTRMPAHPAFQRLEFSPRVAKVARIREDEDWSVIEVTLHDDDEAPPEVLDQIVRSGVRIGRFERVQVPLADLIEDLVGSDGAKTDGE